MMSRKNQPESLPTLIRQAVDRTMAVAHDDSEEFDCHQLATFWSEISSRAGQEFLASTGCIVGALADRVAAKTEKPY